MLVHDTVPRELIWYHLRKRSVPEEYVCFIQNMYLNYKTQVSTVVGKTKDIIIEVGSHQGSTLNPLLFIIILDVIIEKIEEESLWAMLYTDNLGIM